MKVIFLDNDGVICLASQWGSRDRKTKAYAYPNPGKETTIPIEFRFDNFDEKAVKVLNQILEETGAEIVVSSDWRYYATLEELGEYYLLQGIIKKPIGVTNLYRNLFPEEENLHFKFKSELERSMEINHWIENHSEITHWVAIDDMNMSVKFLSDRFASIDGTNKKPGLENFVHTPRSREGIKQSGIKEKILKFL